MGTGKTSGANEIDRWNWAPGFLTSYGGEASRSSHRSRLALLVVQQQNQYSDDVQCCTLNFANFIMVGRCRRANPAPATSPYTTLAVQVTIGRVAQRIGGWCEVTVRRGAGCAQAQRAAWSVRSIGAGTEAGEPADRPAWLPRGFLFLWACLRPPRVPKHACALCAIANRSAATKICYHGRYRHPSP